MAGVLLAWRDKVQGQPCAEPVEALLQGALEQLLAALERALAEKVASINRRAPCTSPFAQSPTSPAPNPQPSTYGFRSFQECSNVCMGHSSWVLHRTGREPPDGEPPSETLLRGKHHCNLIYVTVPTLRLSAFRRNRSVEIRKAHSDYCLTDATALW